MRKDIGTFRGKELDTGEWVMGYFDAAAPPGYAYIITGNEQTCRVDPKTIGRFTGLTDKNCVKIFEGDVVRSRITGEEFIVVWDELYSAFAIHNSKVRYGFPKCNAKTYQVVGNIHDNFDLLEGNWFMPDTRKYITSLSEQKLMRRLIGLILQSPDRCYLCVYRGNSCSNRDCFTGVWLCLQKMKDDR